MILRQRIKEYNEVVYPEVENHNKRLKQLLASPLSDEEKAKVLLFDVNGWCKGCHQWYLRLHKDIYDGAIADIISHRIWEMPLDSFNSFEELYDNIAQWLRRPYINQLTIYDVALRLVIAREKLHLMPRNNVYIHAKPRVVYRYLYQAKLVSYKPTDWNIKVPTNEFSKHFSALIYFESYLIEDLLCYIAKQDFCKKEVTKK